MFVCSNGIMIIILLCWSSWQLSSQGNRTHGKRRKTRLTLKITTLLFATKRDAMQTKSSIGCPRWFCKPEFLNFMPDHQEPIWVFFRPEYGADMWPFPKSTGLPYCHPGDSTCKANQDSQHNLNHTSSSFKLMTGPAWNELNDNPTINKQSRDHNELNHISAISTWVTSPACCQTGAKACLP